MAEALQGAGEDAVHAVRGIQRAVGILEDDLQGADQCLGAAARRKRSEEHTSELQSLMRISYAVFCLKTKNLRRRVRRYTHSIKIKISTILTLFNTSLCVRQIWN